MTTETPRFGAHAGETQCTKTTDGLHVWVEEVETGQATHCYACDEPHPSQPREWDSRPDTHEHIALVRQFVLSIAHNLINRAHLHDRSKLVSPEVEVFDVVTPRLAKLTYDSPEYKASLSEMGGALKHHYENNDHHPEHFLAGIAAMNLPQLTEMLCDWMAAVRRHDDGDIRKSISLNAKRFGYGQEIEQLLLNTVEMFEAES